MIQKYRWYAKNNKKTQIKSNNSKAFKFGSKKNNNSGTERGQEK